MIISRKHGYIFLHCRKAAGSSIAVSLARDLGPDDLQISGIPETVAAGIPLTARVLREANAQARGLLPLFRLFGRHIFARSVARSIDHAHRPRLGRKPPHAPAARVAAAFPQEWGAFAKLCVVRNPWDKTVSDYFWRTKRSLSPPSFAAFVHALGRGDDLGGIVPVDFHDNWQMYTIDGRIVADHVIRYEDLAAGLAGALAQIGVPWDGWLPRAKAASRNRGRPAAHYREMYDATTAAIVGRLYRAEIEAFGYAF